MNIDSRLSYDQSEDQILNSHKNFQTVMARNLCCKWKQPIYFDFDKNMTATIIGEIIIAAKNVG